MKNLVLHVQNRNALHAMWRDGDTMIVGVSGGPDSMCMLDVLTRIARKEHLTLIVAHVNYGLRGADADADEKLVRDVARRHRWRVHVSRPRCDTIVSENTLRALRYAFFEKLRTRYGAATILTAHTQNDQAETVLLHLLRGAGPNGRGGMPFYSSTRIARPFLDVTRDDVLHHLARYQCAYRNDTTNADTSLTRNRIRYRLIPYLARNYNPNIIATLARGAQACRALAAPSVPYTIVGRTRAVSFRADDFARVPTQQQYAFLRSMITALSGNTTNITRGTLTELRKCICSTKPKNQLYSGKNLNLTKKNGTVRLGYRPR